MKAVTLIRKVAIAHTTNDDFTQQNQGIN